MFLSLYHRNWRKTVPEVSARVNDTLRRQQRGSGAITGGGKGLI